MKKRRLALFMALVLLCTSLNGITLSLSAEEVEPVTSEALELVLDEESAEAVLSEAELSASEQSAEEIILPDAAADEAVILDEGTLIVEGIEEMGAPDVESPNMDTATDENLINANNTEEAESILIEDAEIVEDSAEELFSAEPQPAERTEDGSYIGSADYNNPPVIPFESGISLLGAESDSSYSCAQFIIPEEASGEYDFTVSATQNSEFMLCNKDMNIVFLDYDNPKNTTGSVFFAGGQTYYLYYISAWNNELNKITWTFEKTKTWDEIKAEAEQITGTGVFISFEDNNKGKFYEFTVPAGWGNGTSIESYNLHTVILFDSDLQQLNYMNPTLEENSSVYLYVYGDGTCELNIRNQLQESIAQAKEITLGTAVDLNLTENAFLMFKYVADETCEYFLESSDSASISLYTVYDASGQTIPFGPGMQLQKGNTYYLNIACFDYDTTISHWILLTRGKTAGELFEEASVLPAKAEDNNYYVETGIDDYKWYTFTPDKDGYYYIESNSTDQHVVHQEEGVLIYDKIEQNLSAYIYRLKKDVPYCIGVKGNFRNDGTTTIWLSLEYRDGIQDITVTNPRKGYAEKLEDFMRQIEFTVEYADGSTDSIDYWYYNTSYNTETGMHEPCWILQDPVYGWSVRAQIKQNETVFDPRQDLQAGDYVLECSWNNEILETTPVTISSLEEADIPVLPLGKTMIHSSNKSSYPALYKFTAPEKGTYKIKDFSKLYVYEKTETGYDSKHQNNPCLMELEAGETCYLGFCGSIFDYNLNDYNYALQVSVEKAPKLTDIYIKTLNNYQESYIKEVEDIFYTYKAELQLTYDDETTDSVSIYSTNDSVTDDYGNKIESIWYKDGELYTGSRYELDLGGYDIRFCSGELFANKSVSFSVLSLFDLAQEVTIGTENEVTCTDGSVAAIFSAPASGMYAIQSTEGISTLSVRSKNGIKVSGTLRNHQYFAYLKANTVYYLSLKSDHSSSVRLSIEQQPLITKMEVIAKSGTYYAGVAALQDALQVKLTYENGMTAVVGNNTKDNYGNRISCYLLDTENKQDYVSLGSFIRDAGIYTVYPAVVAVNGYSELYKPETVVPAEVEMTLPYSDDLPVLTLNTYERLPAGYMKRWYMFTAPEDGTYDLQKETTSSLYEEIYIAGENRLEMKTDDVSLKAGESCYVYIYTYYPAKFQMIKTDVPLDDDRLGTELPEIIKTDQLYRVDVDGVSSVSAVFVPSEDGVYAIESSNYSNADPYVSLYDVESGAELANNDDDGPDLNFKLVYMLKAGKTYRYQIQNFRDSKDSFSVKLRNVPEEIKVVKQMEFIADTVNLSELISYYTDYIHMKVTYTDGSTELFPVENFTDGFYNKFSYELKQTAITKTQIQYELIVTCYNKITGTAADAKTASFAFAAKKTNALSVFPFNHPVSVNGFNQARHDYLFIPQESGEYMLSAKHPSDSYSYGYVYELGGSELDSRWITLGDARTEAYYFEQGMTYIISIRLYSDDTMQNCSAEYMLTRGNEVESVEIISKPTQQTVVPGTYVLSLAGMAAKITYKNGEQETVAYGSSDSYGKTFSTDYEWLNDQTFEVTVWFGDRMTRFTLPAAAIVLNDLPVLQENVRTDFKGFATFTPERSAAYDIFLEYSSAAYADAYSFLLYDQNGKKITSSSDRTDIETYWLEKGQTYLAAYGDPDITVSALIAEKDNCKWETISQIDPTCTTNGERKEYCTWHEDERTFILPAVAHTEETIPGKAAACTDIGFTEGKKCTVCQTITKSQTTIPAKGHSWGVWTEKEATVFAEGSKTHTCTVCKAQETVKTADKLNPTIELTAKKVTLQTGQSTKKFKVTGLAAGDSIVSMKLAKNKSVKISFVNLKNGTCKLTALKKTGKAKLKITLASGLKKTVTIQVQKGAVKPTSIKVASKEITLKKKQKLSLKPEVLPFTCTEKLTYKTSDKKIVTVSSKGVLKGIKAGKAKITIQAGKKKETVTVTVKKK